MCLSLSCLSVGTVQAEQVGDGYCLTGVNARDLLCVCVGRRAGLLVNTFGLVPVLELLFTRRFAEHWASYAGTKRRNKQIVVFHHLKFTAAAADAVSLSLEPEVPREREAERDRTSHRSLRQTKKVGVDFCQLKTLRMA